MHKYALLYSEYANRDHFFTLEDALIMYKRVLIDEVMDSFEFVFEHLVIHVSQ